MIDAETGILGDAGRDRPPSRDRIDGDSLLKAFDAVYVGLDSGAEPPLLLPPERHSPCPASL